MAASPERHAWRLWTLTGLAAAGFVAVAFLTMRAHIPEAGVSLSLAESRAERVSHVHYIVALRVPSSHRDDIIGRVEITFDLRDAASPLSFDFAQPRDRLLGVTIAGRPVSPMIDAGHIVVPAARLAPGPNTVIFDVRVGDQALNRQTELLYSLFVPARASSAFPCFDQPNLKARWQLNLTVPRGWTAVANGGELRRVDAAGDTTFIFKETPPLPTYLFAFAAGRFSIDTRTVGGRTIRLFHRETEPGRIARNVETIAALHEHALTWLGDYTGIGYPFDKLDVVLIPSFQFGGMEHPGAIFYNANALLLDEAATENQVLARANVIAHETAHMWFGNLVTIPWFNDVWMKEVFANFFAARIANPSFPHVNHALRFLLQNYPAAYDVDRTAGANPIRQPLDNLDEAGSLYGPIIYQKAPIVMRQLEQLVGAEAFQAGVRAYLSAHAFENAGWPELIREMDARSPVDLDRWSRAWIESSGRPTIAVHLASTGGRISDVHLEQSDPRGRGISWTQPLTVALGWPKRMQLFDVAMDASVVQVDEAHGLPEPDWVLPVGGGLGYADFHLDDRSRRALVTGLSQVDDPLTRGAALLVLWDEMLDGRLAVNALREALITALPIESDELNVQQMLDEATTIFWRYTRAEDRPGLAERLEPLLRAGLDAASTTSLRTAWFNALRGVAIRPDTLTWLERVWARIDRVPGLPLSETDETDLAAALALRGGPRTAWMLDVQFARIENPDRKARFAFIMPALSSDPIMRDGFFESLRQPENRLREAWVIDAVRYLHHPLRAEASRRLVRPALQLIPELQRTGDIFLPKRWADETLWGHQDAHTAADVATFIANLPVDYPERLRWVLLSAADPLQRAARLLSSDE